MGNPDSRARVLCQPRCQWKPAWTWGSLHLSDSTPFLFAGFCVLTGYSLGPLPPPTPEWLLPRAQAMGTLLTEARLGQ